MDETRNDHTEVIQTKKDKHVILQVDVSSKVKDNHAKKPTEPQKPSNKQEGLKCGTLEFH